MTAHAMAGDENKSLATGMNDHVTKPIDPDQLFATLKKWIKPREKQGPGQQPEIFVENPGKVKTKPGEAEFPEYLPGFNLSDGLKRLQGNKGLYRKLLLSFARDCCGAAEDIRIALDEMTLSEKVKKIRNSTNACRKDTVNRLNIF